MGGAEFPSLEAESGSGSAALRSDDSGSASTAWPRILHIGQEFMGRTGNNAPASVAAAAAAAAADNMSMTGGPGDIDIPTLEFPGSNSTEAKDLQEAMHAQLCTYLLGWTVMLVLLTGLLWLRRRSRRDAARHKEGFFNIDGIQGHSRRMLTVFIMAVAVIPAGMFVITGFFAIFYSFVEGWALNVSFEYVLAGTAGLSDPLVSVMPKTLAGDYLDLALSAIQFVVSSMVLGLVSSMALVDKIAKRIPKSTCALLRWCLLYLPAGLLVLAAVCGALMAWLEHWSFKIGFFYMAGSFLGVDSPLTDVTPKTDFGLLFDIACMMGEIVFAGVLVGIVSEHQQVGALVENLEGSESESEAEGESESGTEDHDGKTSARLLPVETRRENLFQELEKERAELQRCQAEAAQSAWRIDHIEQELIMYQEGSQRTAYMR